jgi:hypothetical protein
LSTYQAQTLPQNFAHQIARVIVDGFHMLVRVTKDKPDVFRFLQDSVMVSLLLDVTRWCNGGEEKYEVGQGRKK